VGPLERLHAVIHRKRAAYQRTFFGDFKKPHPHAAIVLGDLKRFCGVNRGGIVMSPVTRTADPIATAYRAGMRDVYLRIALYLELDETDIKEVTDHDSGSSSNDT
jgi:hypothetical protein